MDENQVLALMQSSTSKEEWYRNEDFIKQEFNGKLPCFWRELIINADVMQQSSRKWRKNEVIQCGPSIGDLRRALQEIEAKGEEIDIVAVVPIPTRESQVELDKENITGLMIVVRHKISK